MNRFFQQVISAFTVRVQAALLVALCLGSIGLLMFDFVAARVRPEQEREVRGQLSEACLAMVAQANEFAATSDQSGEHAEQLDQQLAAVSDKVLAKFPAIEGGFYAGGDEDRFLGYAFPTRPRPPGDRHRREPPPLEAPYIRLQAKDSLTAPAGEARSLVRDVEASQVMIVTAPVGNARPATLAAWVMFRLVDPRSLTNQVRRYQSSTAMAICGLALAALLLLNLGRSLRNQQLSEVRLRDELRRSEHMAALGKLLAGVAHEVRNPLAAIRSTVQLWERLPESRSGASLESVVQAVDRLNKTVTELLYFSRVDHTDRQPVEINTLINESIDLMAAQAASQGVTVERAFDDQAQPISASPTALSQVFVNLIRNALQSMPIGGQLQVKTEWNSRDRQIQVRVSDTGSGVSPEQQAHLFEPFFTTRPEGTGLGLALCREIVEQHQGRIEYLNGIASGATFQITLPAKL